MFYTPRGRQAETNFAEIAREQGWHTTPSSNQQDCNEHWDWLLTKSGFDERRVDVKAMKSLQRGALPQEEWHWIELHGVRRDDHGWLYDGKADWIAFEQKDCFLIVNRLDLIDTVERLVPPKSPHVRYAAQARYKLYGRQGRCDIITMIESKHLRELAVHIWDKPI